MPTYQEFLNDNYPSIQLTTLIDNTDTSTVKENDTTSKELYAYHIKKILPNNLNTEMPEDKRETLTKNIDDFLGISLLDLTVLKISCNNVYNKFGPYANDLTEKQLKHFKNAMSILNILEAAGNEQRQKASEMMNIINEFKASQSDKEITQFKPEQKIAYVSSSNIASAPKLSPQPIIMEEMIKGEVVKTPEPGSD
ncbi:hypothetical protein L3V79_02890 [Thiotrichales bacterium 19S9-12]|nr:hypothetical protein [Thiotrichales bacterium 19S9-11]MCF6811305.1 hypothetical protein [Thiotrichales bacterium 19S9-12]